MLCIAEVAPSPEVSDWAGIGTKLDTSGTLKDQCWSVNQNVMKNVSKKVAAWCKSMTIGVQFGTPESELGCLGHVN